MSYDRETKYLHPYIAVRLKQIMDAINAKLPAAHAAKLISAHRTPADQFEIFKKGRTFKNGTWIKTGEIFTSKDGFIKLSRHNYLPCTAFDTGIFNGTVYLEDSPLYNHVKEGVNSGMDWGGDWTTLIDQPHLEIPTDKFFKSNIEKDCGLIWQKYLVKAGTYTGMLDGIFGPKSLDALKAATGENERNIEAWNKLFDKFGLSEEPDENTTNLKKINSNFINILESNENERPQPQPGQRPRPQPPVRPRPNPGRRPRPGSN